MKNNSHNSNTNFINKNNGNNADSDNPSKVSSPDNGSESDTDVRVFSIV